MQHASVQPTRRLHTLSAAAALLLLAACGGGGTSTPAASAGPGPGTTPPPVVNTITVTGSVVDTIGAPVVDATVSLGTISGPAPSTQSDTSGNYALPVNPALINTGTVVVVTVAKEGYKSCTGTLNQTDATVTGCNILPLAGADELHPAPADAALVRLGDGEVSGGAANSKLQVATPAGLVKTIRLGWPATGFDLTAYQTFTLNVTIRGMQSVGCADQIVVLQGASAETATALRTFSAVNASLPDSDPDGAFSPYALQVPTSLFSASGGSVYVKMVAGVCVEGTPADPSDDYEFVGLYGKFS
jgi:hypothetical protein